MLIFTFAVACQVNPTGSGQHITGVLDNANLPNSLNLAKMSQYQVENGEIPGLGLSSPVIWDNKIFITSAVSQAETGMALSLAYMAIL